MKIVAVCSDPAVITSMTENLWSALERTDCRPSVQTDGRLIYRSVPYGTEQFVVTLLEGDDLGRLAWSVRGESCAGNWVSVSYDPERGVVTVAADCRRHALRSPGNMAGSVFQIFFTRVTPDGVALAEDILRKFRQVSYDSWRTDVPWWDYDLTPLPTQGDGWRLVAAG